MEFGRVTPKHRFYDAEFEMNDRLGIRVSSIEILKLELQSRKPWKFFVPNATGCLIFRFLLTR